MSAGLLISKLYSRLVWMSTKNPNTNVSDRQTVPFLPVSSDFSSTRNQGRQKLARFNAREFATLIIDLLSDAKRRQQGALSPGLPEPGECYSAQQRLLTRIVN